MSNEDDKRLHSEEYFGKQRDFWWNDDYLELMAKRWRLDQVQSLLDVGCGIGHWGFLLTRFLRTDFQLSGVDQENEWVQRSGDRAKKLGIDPQCEFLCANAMSLPFDDEAFDMVTCQTVLIHLANPSAAIAEFKRVLKPGGLLAVAEPNNLAATLVFSSSSIDDPVEDVTDGVAFHLRCQRGKKRLGLGYNSIGDLVPGFFAENGFADIQVYLSDKATPMIPPYDTEEQQALLQQEHEWKDSEAGGWDQTELKKYFLAGGGDEASFNRYWSKSLKDAARYDDAVASKTEHSAGGTMTYLVSGRK